MNEFLAMLERESDKQVLSALHERLTGLGYKAMTKPSGQGFDIKYSVKSRKPLVAIAYKKGTGFEVHIRPLHVASYAHRLSELSEHIRECCLGGRDCARCGYCDKAYAYEYEGKAYFKCQFICFNFRFTDIQEGDVESILKVLDMELEQIQKG